jgi:hypothetical protein
LGEGKRVRRIAAAVLVASMCIAPPVVARSGRSPCAAAASPHSASASHGSGPRSAGSSHGSRSHSGTGSHNDAAPSVHHDPRGKVAPYPRQLNAFKKQNPFPATGKTCGSCPGYAVDRVKHSRRRKVAFKSSQIRPTLRVRVVSTQGDNTLRCKLRCRPSTPSTSSLIAREKHLRKTTVVVALFAAVLSMPGLALALQVAVHNTGVDSSDALVAAGAQASFWTLSAKPAGAGEAIGSNGFRYHHPAYFADTGSAAWVAPQADGNSGPNGFYTYDLNIDLTGLDPATAVIAGTFGTDNAGAIWLNSNVPVTTTGSGDFGAPTAFTINSGFVAGLNTIHIQVNNEGDPTAFFVSFTRATANAPVAQSIPAVSWPALAALALLLAWLGSLLTKKPRST